MNWYYESGGQQQGPVTETDLDRLLSEGKITLDSLVWREGMSGWTPLRAARPSVAPAPAIPQNLTLEPSVPSAAATPSATAGSDLPQPGWIRCSLTGRYFPPSEIIYLEGKPYSAAAKPQVVASMQTGAVLPGFDSARNGPAWEQRETIGYLPAVIQTCKSVILQPTATFATMKREGGLATPFLFNLSVGSAIGIAVQVLTGVAQFAILGSKAGASSPAGMGRLLGIGAAGVVGGIIMVPIQIAILAFVMPGLLHVALMLVKGANRPFETTFRAHNYLSGGLAPVQIVFGILGLILGVVAAAAPGAALIPSFGMMAIMIPFIGWYFYMTMVALAESHQTTRGKAAGAQLVLLLFCCVVAFIFAMLFGGAMAAIMNRK
jgi:hypothetical protein